MLSFLWKIWYYVFDILDSIDNRKNNGDKK
jgi:hypothetical protein